MTGTATELAPVVEIDDHAVGTGEPGPLTRAVQAVLDDALHGRAEHYRSHLGPLLKALGDDRVTR